MASLVRLHGPKGVDPSTATDSEPAGSGVGLRGRHVVLVSLSGRSLLGLRTALAGAGARVVDASDLSGARRHAAILGPSAALVIDMPRETEAVRVGMTALSGQDAVLLLTATAKATATGAQRIALLRAGADHVLTTDEPGEVIAYLASVLRRGRPDHTVREVDVLRVADLCLDLNTRTATAAGRCLTLTALEFALLAYFMTKAGQALTRQRLLADVWGYDLGGLDTVTVHVRRLRMKIEVDPSRPALLRTVWGTGYRLETGTDTTPVTATGAS
jgi:DNA-binding response OmpR family regulator